MDKNKQIFDDVSSSYSQEVQESISFTGLSHDLFTRAKANLLQDLVFSGTGPLNHRPSLLDLGCGTGLIHSLLSRNGFCVSGIDVSSASIDIAQKSNPDANYYVYDSLTLPFKDDIFDCVTAICVLHHVPLEKRLQFIENAYRVVRPGGSFIVIEHNRWNPLTRYVVSRCELDKEAVLLSRSQLTESLHYAGFNSVYSGYFMLFPTPSLKARHFERLLGRLPFGTQFFSQAFKPVKSSYQN